MASAFKRAAEELYDLSFVHAALFVVGFALTMASQRAMKPLGPCADELYTDYLLVERLTFFFALFTFGAAMIASHVKRRVPEDGGLQGVANARARVLLRLNAALCGVLSAAASILAVAAYTFLLQAKTGRWQCMPTEVRYGAVTTYVVITYAAGTAYYHVGRSILLSN